MKIRFNTKKTSKELKPAAMNTARYTLSLLSVILMLMLVSWGYQGHQRISGGIPFLLPGEMMFFTPEWTDIVRLHASDADYRKQTDPDEGPRHYIDIDNYQEFLSGGTINQNLDSLIEKYGYGFVYDQGILPWATKRSFDSLVSCFERKAWEKAGLFAADLGHYVGDGHMPLHITRNYDGQYTNQNGVHSRFESKMINQYASQIILVYEPVEFVEDVLGYIFDYIYSNYTYVDSILIADKYADSVAGNTTSGLYLQTMWDFSKGFTIDLFQGGSHALTELIYTAWVMAGKPIKYPEAIPEFKPLPAARLMQNFPNPFRSVTNITVEVLSPNTRLSMEVFDVSGLRIETLVDKTMLAGTHEIQWDSKGIRGGIYYCILKTDEAVETRKMVVVH